MTTRMPGRHRAAHKPITPLTPFARAAGRCMSTTVRRGAVVAAGSGLIVSLLGVPAEASPAAGESVTTAQLKTVAQAAQEAASAEASPAAGESATTAQLKTVAQAAQEAASAQQVTVAPAVKVAADTKLTFETGTIKVTPAPEPEPVPVPEPEPEPVVEEAKPAKEQVTAKADADEPAKKKAEPAKEKAEPAKKETEPAKKKAKHAKEKAEPAKKKAEPTKKKSKEEANPAAATGSKVVSIAKQYLGVPYVWAGATPAGFDCSGLTAYVYAQVGIDLPHQSSAQRNAGTEVSAAEARPGDLIWTPGHIAIYAGDGMQIEAPLPGSTVRHTEIWQASPTFIRVI